MRPDHIIIGSGINALVAQQQQAIDALVREVRGLREQSASSSGTSLRDELPPHY